MDQTETAYHYKESGLDTIWLVNGFARHQTGYGSAISITDVRGLHKALAKMLVDAPRPLNGAEFRFLRNELELSQRRLGELLNCDEQALARWEKARTRPVKGAAERMIRALYIEFVKADGTVRRLLERLAELDAVAAPEKIIMRKPDRKPWRQAEA